MLAVAEKLIRLGHLDHAAEVHHAYAVGDEADHGQVVRNEEIGQSQILLEIREDVEHLCLNRHVKRGDRLIAHQQLRVERNAACDAHALALTAGELMRIAAQLRFRQADHLEELTDTLPALLARSDAVDLKRLEHCLLKRHARIERIVRVLKDDLHLAPDALQLLGVHFVNIPSLIVDGALRRLNQAQHRLGKRTLAAARFTDEAKGLARVNSEVDMIHSGQQTGFPLALSANLELFCHIFEVDQILLMQLLIHVLPHFLSPARSVLGLRADSRIENGA